jgi:gamma-glutamylcyclotransferase (GGCT)/AIG2-like uncharacterized protein YtfP
LTVVATPSCAVFVYGTLMPGESRWSALRAFAESWEQATTSGSLWDTGQGYPAAIFAVGGDCFPGVIVTIRQDLWPQAIRRLDRIEDEGVLYRRVEISTSKGNATSYEWIGSTSSLHPMRSGWAGRAADT